MTFDDIGPKKEPVEFEAFRTIEPDAHFIKDPLYEVKYTAEEKFTVVLLLKTKLEHAWSNENALDQVIEEDHFKFARQRTMLLENSIESMSKKMSEQPGLFTSVRLVTT